MSTDQENQKAAEAAAAEAVAKESTKPAARAKKAAPTHQRVIIRKPYGTKDSHMFVGFNLFEGQFAYDKPVTLPVEVVQYLRTLDRVEYSADENGSPQASYSPMYAILDAPEEAAAE